MKKYRFFILWIIFGLFVAYGVQTRLNEFAHGYAPGSDYSFLFIFVSTWLVASVFSYNTERPLGFLLKEGAYELAVILGAILLAVGLIPTLATLIRQRDFASTVASETVVPMKILDRVVFSSAYSADVTQYFTVVPEQNPQAQPIEIRVKSNIQDVEKGQTRDFIKKGDAYFWLEPLPTNLPQIWREGLICTAIGIFLLAFWWPLIKLRNSQNLI